LTDFVTTVKLNDVSKKVKEIIIALLNDEEPPHSTESIKTKTGRENAHLEKIKNLGSKLKSKNHLNKMNQFLASWLGALKKESLAKITRDVVYRIKSAKNFIVEKRLTPHFLMFSLGLVVALCNVLVAQGASNLYSLIPADPSSQVDIANSIDKYTPIITGDSTSVEKIVTLPTDSGSGVFAVDVKTTATQVSQREDSQPAVATGPREKNLSYTVQSGDTLSGLAMRFNVKASSIKFANNMANADLIKPGDVMKIPPDGWEPSAKEIAARDKKLASANRNTVTRSSTSSRNIVVDTRAGSKSNGYPFGWCTYYVATRRAVPTSWGNAGQWLGSANRAGYATGSAPVAGAIVVTRESWWGHVAYVESVDGNTFTVAEMNYKGWGVTSRRTMSANDGVIKGFIY
jgi:surface antigen